MTEGEKKSWRAWKFLGALAMIVLLLCFLPQILTTIGAMSPPRPSAFWILFATCVGLFIKMVIGEFLTDSFEYYKHGYDLCGVAFGISLSSFAIQIASDVDMFPALPQSGWWSVFGAISQDKNNIVLQRSLFLGGLFLITCIGLLITALLSNMVKEGKTHWPNALSGINYVVGGLLLGSCVWIMLSKG